VERGSYDVVLCPWDLRGASWRTVLEHVRSRQPERPLIVFCHCGGEQEWIQVLGAGAFDLLCPPYNEDQVMALIEHAAASRYARSVVNAGAN
jgi:DNA-binding NtrC family response regulator